MRSVLSFLLFCLAASVSYRGQQVLGCSGTSDGRVLDHLQENLDVWAVHNHTIDIRVKNEAEKKLVYSLLQGCRVIVDDVQALIDAEAKAQAAAADADWFEAYHTYDEIVAWYKDLAFSHSDLVTIYSAGQSYERRDQPAVHIGPKGEQKFAIYFQCQIHAREWISGATCNYIVDQIVKAYIAGDPKVTFILDNAILVVIPFTNPDGYAFTWNADGDRLWRKNRNPNGNVCIGTDLNRNYNDHWGQGGSSSNACSDTYKGPTVASEPEVKNTAGYFSTIAAKTPIVAAIDWHSYGQLVLRPYGWTSTKAPDETVLKARGDQYAADVLKETPGYSYTSEPSIDLYVTTGTASDWFYGDQATSVNGGYKAAGYTVELSPVNNPPGFVLPPAQIITVGKGNYAAVVNFLQYFVTDPIEA